MRNVILTRCVPEPNSGCWLWLGGMNVANGYGYAPTGRRGGIRLAHRVSYEAFVGPIPVGLHIDHRCKVRLCVNPEHLEAVTQTINNQRQAHRGFANRHHPIRLTVEVVIELRRRYASGERERAIAERTGINESTVRDIVRGRTWRSV